MGLKAPKPVMRRLPCGCAHPLLIDRLLHVQAGQDDAETLQRIAEACAAADVELERAVACVAPTAARQGGVKDGKVTVRVAGSSPNQRSGNHGDS